MAAHIPCRCSGPRKERMKHWFVSLRNGNYSYFEYPKGAFHSSDYSTVNCRNCQMSVRSKASFVATLPDGVQ
jgi:hypothetical protein